MKKICIKDGCTNELNKGKMYCSNKCQKDVKYLSYIQRWKDGKVSGEIIKYRQGHRTIGPSNYVRRFLFEINGSKCSQCGWGEINKYNDRIPLEIDHLDGDPLNNRPENLKLLCPNCHSLTSTYRNTKRK